MKFLRGIFTIDLGYLIKSYIISGILTFIIFSNGEGITAGTGFYFILAAILFPFSALVWDEFVNLMLGNNIIILPLVIMLAWKVTKIIMLYAFSIFIAPFGILYLCIRNRIS